MMKRMVMAVAIGCVTTCLSARVCAEDELVPELKVMGSMLGAWEVEAQWEGGSSLWARTLRESILGGQFIESRTWVRDGGGAVYLRYHAIFGPGDAERTLNSYVFSHDGTMRQEVMSISGDAGEQMLTSSWKVDETNIVFESVGVPSGMEDDSSSWKVSMNLGGNRIIEVMDAEWKRVDGMHEPAMRARPVHEALAPMARFTGVWEIETEWARGGSLWSRTSMEAAPHGQYLHSWVESSDDGGPVYDRYRIFFVPGEDGVSMDEYMFTHTGDVMHGRAVVEDGAVVIRYDAASENEPTIVKTYRGSGVDDTTENHWTVDMFQDDAAPGMRLVEGTWHRVNDRVTYASDVDVSTFVTDGVAVRRFTLRERIDAPVSAVYSAFTDGEGFAQAFAPDSAIISANIDLAIGGRYEWLFDGVIGSNGCQVLSYVPDRMLSFSWNAPPSHETRGLNTWVVVEFEESDGGGTGVRLTHLGFGEGASWDETFVYFQGAWASVLGQMKVHLEE